MLEDAKHKQCLSQEGSSQRLLSADTGALLLAPWAALLLPVLSLPAPLQLQPHLFSLQR